MGAWSFIEPNLEWVLERIDAQARRARYAGRPASASTATGQLSASTSGAEDAGRGGARRAEAASSPSGA